LPFAFDLSQATPVLIAYENVSALVPDPYPTISAQLIAGWQCPECDQVLRAIAGPWSDPRANWWEYDHHDNAHGSDKKTVRPVHADQMPRHRGDFGLDGGYLYRFDHRRSGTEHDYSYYQNLPKCRLGVSLRLGIENGVRRMQHATPTSTRKLVAGLTEFGSSDLLKLIPDVLGQREPLVATTPEFDKEWQAAKSGQYHEDKLQQTWESFAVRLYAQHKMI
jgi:hypothetical protein